MPVDRVHVQVAGDPEACGCLRAGRRSGTRDTGGHYRGDRDEQSRQHLAHAQEFAVVHRGPCYVTPAIGRALPPRPEPIRMRRALIAAVGVIALVAPGTVALSATQSSASRVSDGDAVANVSGKSATLSNGRVARKWSLDRGVRTVDLVGPSGRALARPGPDFRI